jgi:hypothetical protein
VDNLLGEPNKLPAVCESANFHKPAPAPATKNGVPECSDLFRAERSLGPARGREVGAALHPARPRPDASIALVARLFRIRTETRSTALQRTLLGIRW